MDIFQIDEAGHLFISPDIDDWKPVTERGITAIFDLDDDLDIGVPNLPNQLLYIYFPFDDKDLPDLHRLHELAQLGASLVANGGRVLSHCGMGHNRSALLAGLILTYLGMNGADAVKLIQSKRKGALYNQCYAAYLQSLQAAPKSHEVRLTTKTQSTPMLAAQPHAQYAIAEVIAEIAVEVPHPILDKVLQCA
jgi:protein-tyrosine phosphatase